VKSVEEMYERDPDAFRFVTKYRHTEGCMEIKVTDNHQVIKFCTEHAQDVRKLEKLSSQLMRRMVNRDSGCSVAPVAR